MMNTPPFDSAILVSVILFAVTVFFLMRFVPPVGAKLVLGGAVGRFAGVPPETLEDAVKEEGKRAYYSLAGLVAIVMCGFIWRVVMFYSPIIDHSLRAAGVNGVLAFVVSMIPAILPPFLYKYTTRWLLVRRLDRKFGHA